MAYLLNRLARLVIAAGLSLVLCVPAWPQAALLPNAKQTFVDQNGKPLTGGKVFSYVPNTTVKKTTWSDSGQTTQNANPITLDAAGRAVIYGQGSYQQEVRDSLGNVIWNAPTTAWNSAAPSGATGTDTAPVGTVMPFSGFVVPTNWALAYGQTLSRTTYSDLLTALTISDTSVSCVATSSTLSGWADTSQMRVGAPVEASCVPTGTVIVSIAGATSIVVNNNAVSTATVTATVFPWGNGDGVATFTVPDLRGRTFAGADAMGGTAASRLTSTYYGASAAAPGVAGGSQSHALSATELPITGYSSAVTDPGHAHTQIVSSAAGATIVPAQVGASTTVDGNLTALTVTNITVATTVPTGGNAHAIVQPTLTVNYIIKVAPNTTGAGGVVSIGGLFGDVLCDTTFACPSVGGANDIGLVTQSTLTMLANATGSTAQPTAVTNTAWLDATCGSAQGNIIYRGASTWDCLPPGTNGQALVTHGAAANPEWLSVVSTGLANPTATVGPTATNGTATTAIRSDGAPAINLTETYPWTGPHTFNTSNLRVKGSSTGYTAFTSPNSGATNYSLALPAVNDTLAVLGTPQVFTATQAVQGTAGNVYAGSTTSGLLNVVRTGGKGGLDFTQNASDGGFAMRGFQDDGGDPTFYMSSGYGYYSRTELVISGHYGGSGSSYRIYPAHEGVNTVEGLQANGMISVWNDVNQGSSITARLNSATSSDNFFQGISWDGNINYLLTGDSIYFGVGTGTPHGSYTFTTNPTNGQTIILNGVTWTFVTSGATGAQTNIKATLALTIAQLYLDIIALADPALIDAEYYNYTDTVLNIIYKYPGTAGLAYTLGAGTYGGTISGATLTGGVDVSFGRAGPGLWNIGFGGNSTPQLQFTPDSGQTMAFGTISGGGQLILFGATTKMMSFANVDLILRSDGALKFSASTDPTSTTNISLFPGAASRLDLATTAAASTEQFRFIPDSGATTGFGSQTGGGGLGVFAGGVAKMAFKVGDIVINSEGSFRAASTTDPFGATDAFIRRGGAGDWRMGDNAAASPVSQRLSVQSVATGTADTAGAHRYYDASRGTGTGAGGSHIFTVAPAGGAGSTQNALATALTIDSTKLATFAGTVIIGGGAAITSSGAGGALSALAFSTDAANLSGTVASARVSGSYTGITGVGTVTAGVWNAGAVTASAGITSVLAGASGTFFTSTVSGGSANDIYFNNNTGSFALYTGGVINFSITKTGSVSIPTLGLVIGGPTGGDKGMGTINAQTAYYANGTIGATCGPGAPTAGFTVVGGIVTVC